MFITQLAYQGNSAGVFTHFANQPYSVFLDSCGKDRFDIIAADPAQVLRIEDDSQDPFAQTIQILHNQYDFAHETPSPLPFTIGAIGYLSYDIGYSLLGLKPHMAADIPLPLAVIGFYDWSIITDHWEKITYLCSRRPVSAPEIQSIIHKISNPHPRGKPHFLITRCFQANMPETDYASAFFRIKEHIQAGDCYQINLAQRFSAHYQGSLWDAYQILRQENPMPMAAFFQLDPEAILCLSPEQFIKVVDREVLTQPIKGTRGRFVNPEQDRLSAKELLLSEKDRAENIMIVDLLRNDLSKCCRPGSVKVPQLCSLQSFPSVHHLVSTITGTLEDGRHSLDLLRNCFPGGSITGAPKRRAMEIIDQLEPHRRSLYCGSIFSCDFRGRLESNIAIRTVLGTQNQLYCYGGGGIVKDSIREQEYQEIQLKISRLINSLS